eukprot:COSAG04_NODE_3405_length_2844_cov_3.814208_5_plen_74_part_00
MAVAGCLKDNNFRVCQGSLSVLAILIEQMGEDFRPFVGTVCRAPRARCRYSMPATRACRHIADSARPRRCCRA